jgi:ABC-type transport system involved in multi-copper enzyme maturation permease subunit
VRAFALIAGRDIRDLMSSVAFRILAAALLILAAALAAGAALLLVPPPGGVPEAPENPTASVLIGTMLYFTSLLPFLALLWVFAGAILMKEKASGHLETLLATPLSTRTLWLAKTAAVALPGLAMAFLSSALIVMAVVVAARVRPDAGAFAFPPALLVVCWLGNPLLFSGLGAVTTLLALRSSPDTAIVPSFAVGFGLMSAVPVGMAVGVFDLSSWVFAAGYLGAAAVEWVVVLVLAHGLTKERIVLSSRED